MLKEVVIVYAEKKKAYDELKNILSAKRKSFDIENESLINLISEKGKEVDDLADAVRLAAVEAFKETGEKKLFGGIGIRERASLSYDKEAAFSWAKEKDMFLCLDSKAFEKAAAGLKLSFVKETKEPQVTFPKEVKVDE